MSARSRIRLPRTAPGSEPRPLAGKGDRELSFMRNQSIGFIPQNTAALAKS